MVLFTVSSTISTHLCPDERSISFSKQVSWSTFLFTFFTHWLTFFVSYNNFNKQQYNNIQSQAFGQNYQHQAHHHQQHYNAPTPQHQHNQGSYQSNRNVIPITSFKNDMNPDGSYAYSYSTGNGIRADESGYVKNRGSQNQAQVAQGSYSYTAPNGQLIEGKFKDKF